MQKYVRDATMHRNCILNLHTLLISHWPLLSRPELCFPDQSLIGSASYITPFITNYTVVAWSDDYSSDNVNRLKSLSCFEDTPSALRFSPSHLLSSHLICARWLSIIFPPLSAEWRYVTSSRVETHSGWNNPTRTMWEAGWGISYDPVTCVGQFKMRERTAAWFSQRLSNVTSHRHGNPQNHLKPVEWLGSSRARQEPAARCEIHATINRETMIARKPCTRIYVTSLNVREQFEMTNYSNEGKGKGNM